MRVSEPLQFVFAFAEDGSLQVFASPRDAVREFEGVDVESGVVKFYDGYGVHLQPVFSTANRTGKILGLFSWVVSGVYELAADPRPTEDSFALALLKTRVLEPNVWFSSIEQLRSALASKGVQVEWDGRTEK